MSRASSITLFLHTVIVLLSGGLILTSSACFITNCPPGGKRSGRFALETRECTPCGPPELNGQCYGPQTCCSKAFGCLIGTPETKQCDLENTLPTPCENSGKSCGGFDPTQPINGHCAAEGICCSSEVCTMDPACNWGDIVPNAAPISLILSSATPEDEDCEDPEAKNKNSMWKQDQVLFPRLGYGIPHPSLHYELLNTKRFYDGEPSLDKRSNVNGNMNANGNEKNKFPVLLKSRPGLNSIVRKLFQIRKRSPPQLKTVQVHDDDKSKE